MTVYYSGNVQQGDLPRIFKILIELAQKYPRDYWHFTAVSQHPVRPYTEQFNAYRLSEGEHGLQLEEGENRGAARIRVEFRSNMSIYESYLSGDGWYVGFEPQPVYVFISDELIEVRLKDSFDPGSDWDPTTKTEYPHEVYMAEDSLRVRFPLLLFDVVYTLERKPNDK